MRVGPFTCNGRARAPNVPLLYFILVGQLAMASHTFISWPRNLTVCVAPKAGSTTWRSFVYEISGMNKQKRSAAFGQDDLVLDTLNEKRWWNHRAYADLQNSSLRACAVAGDSVHDGA